MMGQPLLFFVSKWITPTCFFNGPAIRYFPE